MVKWITLGDWNKNYFLIILLVIVGILTDYIFGYVFNSNFEMIKLFPLYSRMTQGIKAYYFYLQQLPLLFFLFN